MKKVTITVALVLASVAGISLFFATRQEEMDATNAAARQQQTEKQPASSDSRGAVEEAGATNSAARQQKQKSEEQLAPPLVFRASFEDSVDAVSRGNGKPLKVEGPLEFRPGRFGKALLCGEGGATISYASQDVLRPAGGTVEMWVCPLDWTADEDEFHVFLEAQATAPDAGWLVFYRYFQGGLMTILGTNASTYRAAGGPRFKWKPGEWHHVAGVWRSSGLETYVDGQRVGAVDHPPVPARFAPLFSVGDRPWNVPRKRQTLLDEVKIYCVPLEAASIARASRGEPIDFKPQVALRVTPDPDRSQLHVACDAAGLIAGPLGGKAARIELAPKGKAEPSIRTEITAFPQDVGRCDLSVDRLPPGDYQVRGVLVGESGAELAQAAHPFHMPGPPVWSGNQLGMTDKVLPPWTPLKCDPASSSIECWGRRYRFGTLLDQVESSGTDLLAAPVTLEAVIGGKSVSLSGPVCRLDRVTDGKATLTGRAAAGDLRVELGHEIEFDGFTWTRLLVDATQPVRLDELRLVWKMPRSQAVLLHSDTFQASNNPAGRLGPKGWSSPLTVCFWLGNEERGLAWYTESGPDWLQSMNRPTIEVVPEGDQVKVTVRLIAQPATVSSRREYAFGLMATPVRPRPKQARRWRMDPGVRHTFTILWPNSWMKWYGHPEPKAPQKFAAGVKAMHKQGCRVVPYLNLNYVSAGIPEWQYYSPRWADPDRVVPLATYHDVAAMGHPTVGVNPAVRDWQDYILYHLNEVIDRYEVDGIYIDCWSPSPCKAEPCGWRDEQGTRHGTWPLRAYREILRRSYALVHEKRPNALVMVHMSSEMNIPMLSFADATLDGEQFLGGSRKLKDDYLDVLPPDMFRAEFLGRNWGPVSFFLPEFRDGHEKVGTPNLAAYLLLHDVNAWPIWSDTAVWNRLYNALDAADAVDAEFLPYWGSSGVQADPRVLVSSYRTKSAVILAVMNTGDATQAKITLDPKRLKLSGISTVVDAIHNEPMKSAGLSITMPLARHQGRVLVVKP